MPFLLFKNRRKISDIYKNSSWLIYRAGSEFFHQRIPLKIDEKPSRKIRKKIAYKFLIFFEFFYCIFRDLVYNKYRSSYT